MSHGDKIPFEKSAARQFIENRDALFAEMDSRSRGGPGSRPPPRRQENSHALPKGTLPKKLQLFFAPHAPIPYAAPIKKKKPALPYTGVAQYVMSFAEPVAETPPESDAANRGNKNERKFRNPEYAVQCRVGVETKAEKRLKLRRIRVERNAAKIAAAMREWEPAKDDKIQGDPYKTLFLARVSYQVTERELKEVFEEYGPIRTVRVVRDLNSGKSRGYAFVEYEHTAHMKEAYKHADGVKIEGRRVLVDVERGRTMEGWRPARLGGGLGAQTRKPKKPQSSRTEKSSAPDTRDHRSYRSETTRDSRMGGRPRDYGASRGAESSRPPRSGRDHRSTRPEDYRDHGGHPRDRERRYEGRYDRERYDRERPSRYDKRYREIPPPEHDDR